MDRTAAFSSSCYAIHLPQSLVGATAGGTPHWNAYHQPAGLMNTSCQQQQQHQHQVMYQCPHSQLSGWQCCTIGGHQHNPAQHLPQPAAVNSRLSRGYSCQDFHQHQRSRQYEILSSDESDKSDERYDEARQSQARPQQHQQKFRGSQHQLNFSRLAHGRDQQVDDSCIGELHTRRRRTSSSSRINRDEQQKQHNRASASAFRSTAAAAPASAAASAAVPDELLKHQHQQQQRHPGRPSMLQTDSIRPSQHQPSKRCPDSPPIYRDERRQHQHQHQHHQHCIRHHHYQSSTNEESSAGAAAAATATDVDEANATFLHYGKIGGNRI